MSKLSFIGTHEQLVKQLAGVVTSYGWAVLNMGTHYQYRRPDGAVCNWWPSTGTISCQGPEAAAAEMHEQIVEAFSRRSPTPSQYQDETDWWEAGL